MMVSAIASNQEVRRGIQRVEGLLPLLGMPLLISPSLCYELSECRKYMLQATNFEGLRRRSWCAAIVVLAVFALTVSVATRYCAPQGSSTYAVRTAHKHSSPEQIRQHLTKSAVNWMPQVVQTGILQDATFYPRIAPAGPPVPGLLLEKSLYNRPPPCC